MYAAAMGYPEELLGSDEQVMMDFRPHWSRILKEVVISVAAVAILLVLAVFFDFQAKWWVLGALVAVWAVLVAGGVVRWWFTEHVVTTERVILRTGVLSRESKEIPLEAINDVSFRQSLFGRLFGSGDLFIASAGEAGYTEYDDIPRPQVMQKQIYDVREQRLMSIEGGGRREPDGISKAQQLEILSRLHDQGKLTDEEFQAQKRALDEGGV